MRRLFLSVLPLLFAGQAMAADSREESLRKISETLAAINAQMVQASQPPGASAHGVYTAGMIDRALKQLADLAEEFRDNPYVEVKGFTLGLPWNLSINLEIRPTAPAAEKK